MVHSVCRAVREAHKYQYVYLAFEGGELMKFCMQGLITYS